MSGVIELREGDTTCGIAPAMGCSITHFRTIAGGVPMDWMRPYDPHHAETVPSAASGCFPLVPYSGRIADGVLFWRKREYRLPIGLLGDAHALHGTGWVSPWEACGITRSAAEFVHACSGADWPFPFEAVLRFEVAERALRVVMGIANLGDEDMPVGLGLHPIYSGRGLRLRANAATVWNIDDRKLFAGRAAVEPPWDFRNGAPLLGTALEHGFSGWDGTFELTWPDREEVLTVAASQPLRHLVVYTRAYGERGDGFVCVEPVSHSVDAFNLAVRGIPHTGTLTLAAGQNLSAEVEFRVDGLSAH